MLGCVCRCSWKEGRHVQVVLDCTFNECGLELYKILPLKLVN